MAFRHSSAQQQSTLVGYWREHPAAFINDVGTTFDPRNVERGRVNSVDRRPILRSCGWIRCVSIPRLEFRARAIPGHAPVTACRQICPRRGLLGVDGAVRDRGHGGGGGGAMKRRKKHLDLVAQLRKVENSISVDCVVMRGNVNAVTEPPKRRSISSGPCGDRFAIFLNYVGSLKRVEIR